MAQTGSVAVQPSALWPQGDIRDPLGVWGFRLGFVGDASGGSIKMTATEATDRKAAYVYTCYALTIAGLTGNLIDTSGKVRLLTNWPNVDPLAGVQAFSTLQRFLMNFSTNFTAPILAPDTYVVEANERFLLLFDPRPSGPLADIVEMEIAANVDLATYSFEGYGYFWDRSVLNAPGGPRHPGAS